MENSILKKKGARPLGTRATWSLTHETLSLAWVLANGMPILSIRKQCDSLPIETLVMDRNNTPIDEARTEGASSALWLIRNYQFFSNSSQYESRLSESEKDLVTDASGLWAS